MNGLLILGAILIIAFGIVLSTAIISYSDSECPCHHGGMLCSLCEDELSEVANEDD
ncbi:hypothetical protein [Streptococcus uberis]|uniref:hypothetical protein n=1 Tax=Streptococcus uberis TaxID=1349 RepID=UPI003D7824AB